MLNLGKQEKLNIVSMEKRASFLIMKSKCFTGLSSFPMKKLLVTKCINQSFENLLTPLVCVCHFNERIKTHGLQSL